MGAEREWVSSVERAAVEIRRLARHSPPFQSKLRAPETGTDLMNFSGVVVAALGSVATAAFSLSPESGPLPKKWRRARLVLWWRSLSLYAARRNGTIGKGRWASGDPHRYAGERWREGWRTAKSMKAYREGWDCRRNALLHHPKARPPRLFRPRLVSHLTPFSHFSAFPLSPFGPNSSYKLGQMIFFIELV